MDVTYLFSEGRKGLFVLALFILLYSVNIFGQSHIVNEVTTVPAFPVDPSPKRVLVLSTVDLKERSYRSSKEELFAELIDSVMLEISRILKDHDQIPCKVLFGTTFVDSTGSTVFTQMKQYEASHAIEISFFNVHFPQTEVQVTEDKNGKEKEAYYDIESIVDYQLYNDQVMAMAMPMTTSRYHSHRSVLSGLLAAGPNVVKNREDALSISRENAWKYLMQFFPLSVQRTRKLFDKKELSKVKAAIANKDFDQALAESQRFTHNSKRKLAAKANYNCAVLMENRHQPREAKLYLQESLGLFSLPVALSLKTDYGLE